MVIIRCNLFVKAEGMAKLHAELVRQADTGVILLPCGFELLNEVPADEEIAVVIPKEK